MRKATGNEKLTCEPILAGENMTGKDVVMMVLVKPITLNFLEPMVFALNLYIALIYGNEAVQPPQNMMLTSYRPFVHLVRVVPNRFC